jgi:hypothetical protein
MDNTGLRKRGLLTKGFRMPRCLKRIKSAALSEVQKAADVKIMLLFLTESVRKAN